jgi:GcrA cell cycle regulator
MNTNPPWSDEENAELTRLWDTGLSSVKIAKIMGKTKNAVCGKVNRLGLPARPSPIPGRKPPVARVPKQIEKQVIASPKAPVMVKPQPTPMPKYTRRETRCAWPIGDPKKPSFHFCCDPVESGAVYCPAHESIAYVRVNKAA